jgi:flagellar hook-associated protein 3 FlgL
VIRIIDGSAEKFLVDLTRIQNGIEAASRQVTSGLRVERPSDDPGSVGDILMLRESLSWNTQVLSNLERLQAEARTAEEALAQAVQLIDQASTFGSQGAGGSATSELRLTLAGEVSGVLEQLVGISRTTSGDRFIFSGDLDNVPIYELNLQAPGGVTQIASPSSTRQVRDADGGTLPVTRTAAEVFDDPQASVFAAVDSLRRALENNSETDVRAALDSLKQAGDALNVHLSYYGSMQTRVDNAVDRARKIDLNRQAELSSHCDADLPAAILALTQGQSQEEAALSAQANNPGTSLFDYLR